MEWHLQQHASDYPLWLLDWSVDLYPKCAARQWEFSDIVKQSSICWKPIEVILRDHQSLWFLWVILKCMDSYLSHTHFLQSKLSKVAKNSDQTDESLLEGYL